jgi:hypothetical protein
MANGLFNLKQVIQAVQQGGWPAQKPPAVEYLVVAGGGGAAAYASGGAGGLLQGLDTVPNGQTLLVTVGAGGTNSPTNGGNSVFGTMTSTGGGRDGSKNGGSGSGGNRGPAQNTIDVGGQGVLGQGNAGGFGRDIVANVFGGGGGGASTVGQNASLGSICGSGGSGIASVISGTVTAYAGGGGGGHAFGAASSAGAGGAGGGGGGGNAVAPSPANGYPGTANTGGGGGAASYNGYSPVGGAGGSGIVIVSYPDVYTAASATTGSPTVSTSGSGSVSFNGSSQFVYAPSSYNIANFSVGQAYTFECWMYQTSSPGCSITQGGANTFSITLTSGNAVNIGKSGVIDFIQSSSSVFTNNTWVHLAVSRNTNNVTRLWINGTSVGSSSSDTYAYNSANQYIGSNSNPSSYFPGYLSNVRFVKGTAVYDPTQTTITVPTAPLTAITNTTLLLSSVSGAQLADSSSSSAILVASSTVPTWNALSPFSVTGYKNRVYTWTSSGSITF